ncbi:MAG: hypothetical protein N2115_03395 [bacterium]|nr:hypothetical protein [bacterium]
MEKFLILIFLLAGLYAYCRDGSFSRTSEQIQGQTEKRMLEPSEIASKAKEFLEIQKKLFDMEKDVIQQDPELKQIAEQIKQLQQQLRERVEEKLKTNEEYQSLRQRREQIRQEYTRAGFKPNQPPVRRFERK